MASFTIGQPVLFTLAQRHSAVSGGLSADSADARIESMVLNEERVFEVLGEPEWDAWLAPVDGTPASRVVVRPWVEDVLFGGRLTSPEGQRAELIKHITTQSTNLLTVQVLGMRSDHEVGAFITPRQPRTPVATSANIEMNLFRFSDLPDFKCYQLLTQHFNAVANSSRKRLWGGSGSQKINKMYSESESDTMIKFRRIAESMAIDVGDCFSVSISGDELEVAGVLKIDAMDDGVAASTIYLLDGDLRIDKGTLLHRSASVRCGSITRRETAVVGKVV